MSTLWTRLALLAALSVGLSTPLYAMGNAPPADAAKPAECKEADKSKCPASADAPAKKDAVPDCQEADKSKCPGKQGFLERYKAALALIEEKKYDEALAAMRALDDGSSADVINYIGYINRKMGKMAEAQMYYEAALHMVPNHRGALEYYGEWYCMMGNLEKARQNLRLIGSLYGVDTKEYLALAKMIDEAAAQQKS
jgi:predicted Zn-dependent protease